MFMLLLITGCASFAGIGSGEVTAFRLLSASGDEVGASIEIQPPSTVLTENDAARLVRRLVPFRLGKRFAADTITSQSGSRTWRRTFYEGGVMTLERRHDGPGIIVIDFLPFRVVDAQLSHCEPIQVVPATETVLLVDIGGDRYYVHDRPPACHQGEMMKSLSVAGPVGEELQRVPLTVD
jgi:hypothetical protein